MRISRREFIELPILATIGLLAPLSLEEEEFRYVRINKICRSSPGYILYVEDYSGKEYYLYFNPSFGEKTFIHEIEGYVGVRYRKSHLMKIYNMHEEIKIDGEITEIIPIMEEKKIKVERSAERLKERVEKGF